jgi:hypothetical protein
MLAVERRASRAETIRWNIEPPQARCCRLTTQERTALVDNALALAYASTFSRITKFTGLTNQLGDVPTELWSDALEFWKAAEKRGVSKQQRARLLRAAVLLSAAAFEGVTNFLAERVAQAGAAAGRALSEAKIHALREKRMVLRDSGELKEQDARYTSLARFLFLFLIVAGTSANDALRRSLQGAFDTRNDLVHPKPRQFADASQSERHLATFNAFLAADILLIEAWAEARSHPWPSS